MPIGRLELHDLKNERPIVHHAAGSDGSESLGVDRLGFPQECFFLILSAAHTEPAPPPLLLLYITKMFTCLV
jgi:hypothetical protein